MILVLEARYRIIRLFLERGAGHPAGAQRLEQGQPAAMQQIVDQRRDEDGLAGTRQAGDAEPDGRIDQIGGAIGQIF